jgi:3',5'-cyclic-AMP phosphodiesterase
MEKLNRKNFLKLIGVSSLAMLSSKSSAAGLLSSFDEEKVPSKPFRVAHLTDIHIQSGLVAEKGFASCLHAVNSLAQKPDMILNGGDAIMNAAFTFSKDKIKKQWGLFHDILVNDNSIPIHHCIGNHDLYGWPLATSFEDESKHTAMDEYKMKTPYYAMQQGKWKFIVLDSIRAKNSIPGYYAELDEEQMLWLKDELQNTPKDLFICIVTHVPVLAVCTLFDGKKDKTHWSIPNNCLHGDAAELTALFYQYPNIKACLSGHIHMIDHVNYLGVDYYCNGAVSGSWWKGNHYQFAPSFSVMNFYDDGKVSRDIQYYNWQPA